MSIWNTIAQGIDAYDSTAQKALALQQLQDAMRQQGQFGNALMGIGGGPQGAPGMPPGAPSQTPPQQGVVPPVANGAAAGAPAVPQAPAGPPPNMRGMIAQPPSQPPAGSPAPPRPATMGQQGAPPPPPPKAAQIYTAALAKMKQQTPPPSSPGQAVDNVNASTAPSGGDQSTMFDPLQTLGKLAQLVESKNPGIKPYDLAGAVEMLVKGMSGIAPDMKQQLALEAMRAKYQFDTWKQLDTDKEKNDLQANALNTKVQLAMMGETSAMQRVQFIQNAIDRRAATNAGYKQQSLVDKQLIAKANAAVQDAARELASAQSTANSHMGSNADANKALEDALTKYKQAAEARQSVEDNVLASMASGGGAAPAGGGGKPDPAKIKAITDAYKAGKLTKDQAHAQLKALGVPE